MKSKSIIVVTCILFYQSFVAQEWQKNLKPNANFYEIQEAFNTYWNNSAVPFNEHMNIKDGEFKHYKRWEYFMKSRLDSNGYFPGYQLYNEFNKISKSKRTQSTTAANWEYIGAPFVPDYGGAGRVNTIEFDPTDYNTMWLGSAAGGLWKTTDGGTSWSSNTDFLPNISVADIAIDPSNTSIMYLATGDNSGYESSGSFSGFWGGTYSAGLLKSVDGGISWNQTGLTYSQSNKNIIQKIVLFPNNPQILLVANRTSIQRSTNGGATWTNVKNNHVYDFELDPSNPNIVYAVGNGICLKSVNQGLSWTSTSVTGASSGLRMSVSISASAPQTVYVLDETGNLYVSTNSGVNFSFVTNVPSTANITLYGYYDCVLAVSPVNSNEIYVAGLEIAQSLDGGNSWQVMSDWAGFPDPGYVHADNHYIEFLPNSGTTLFSCNDGGVFKSTDNAVSWTDISANVEIAQYYRISSAQTMPSRYYMGQQDNGTVMADGGIFSVVLGGDGMDCVVDNTNPDNAIVSYQYGNFYNTTDNWFSYNDITVPGGIGAWITPIQLHPSNQSIIYAAYEDVYVSPDFGATWNPISFGLATDGLEALAIAPSNADYIYTSIGNTLHRTNDGGTTWLSTNSGLPSALNKITSICVSNSNPGKVWVTYGGYTSGSKIFMSIDGGANWTNYSGTLPNIPAHTIVHQASTNDELYVGTDFGVYYRNSSMPDWVPFQTNLPNVIVNELEIVPGLNAIRAATFGRGVWQSPLNSNILTALPGNKFEDRFFSILPNPSSGIVYLNITSNDDLYNVKITDLLGKTIFENAAVKLKNYKIDLSAFENGCYVISASNKKESHSNKIVLHK